jgi:hypothetical protein
MKGNYVEGNDHDFSAQLITFKEEIGSYVAVLKLTPDQVSGQAADADYFEYCLKCLDILQKAATQATTWKDIMRGGGTPPPTGAPAAPVLPASVPAVAPGIEARFRALVKLIKANPAYNTAMGQALGIEGPQQTPPDLTTIQPEIDVYINGANVFVDWNWGGYVNYLDMCEIQVDRGDGKGFVALAFDTTPGYTDPAPIPAAPVKWTYRAIYRVNDAQVGLWSKLVSLIVGG